MIEYFNMLDFLFVQRGNRSFECFISLMHNIFFCLHFYKTAGRELCIAIDVALAKGGCEAVVESYYSVMKCHKQVHT